MYLNTCYIGALCLPHLQAHVGCWVNTKLWASLISLPHTAISLNSARPLMAWEVALAIPKRMSWASLQHIHHMARASWEGGTALPLVQQTCWGVCTGFVPTHMWEEGSPQHCARRAHEWSFSPPPPGVAKCLCMQGASAFSGRQYLLPTHTFPSIGTELVSLPWRSAFLRTFQGQRSSSRQKITELQQAAIGHSGQERPNQTANRKKSEGSFFSSLTKMAVKGQTRGF